MKKYIDRLLLQLQNSIHFFRMWCAECHDSYLVTDARFFAEAVGNNMDIVRTYYKHWTSEFTIAQHNRMVRLLSFDVWREYNEYVKKYAVRHYVSDDDLPF